MVKKFDYDGAKEAGYSDEEISKFLQSKHPKFKFKEAEKEGYSLPEINAYLSSYNPSEKVSSKRSAIGAPIKGLIQGIQEQASAFAPFVSGLGTSPISKQFQEEQLEELIPVKEEHKALERAGRLIPTVALGEESIPLKAAQLAAATAGGELAKISGAGELGQTFAEAGAMTIPGLAKLAGQKAMQLASGIKNVITSPAEKTASGLTKIEAIGAKRPELGTISTARQAKTIESLNKEASQLTRESVHKHLPVAEQIEKGIDIEGPQKLRFASLKRAAEKHNPEIDTGPLSNVFVDYQEKFRGIPNPSPQAKKILNEIQKFRQNPQRNLNNLLKIYRDNNAKQKSIFETAQLKGTQKEYSDFLSQMNESISKSIENTLPQDSAWLKEFKTLNKEYADQRKAYKVMGDLKGILSETPTEAQIKRIAEDAKIQRRLELSLGDKGSKEVIDIAKDQLQAHRAIKKIGKNELNTFDAAYPLYYAVPYLGKALGLHKAKKIGRYAYGWFLSTPSKRSAYKDLLKSLSEGNLEGYKKAATVLKRHAGVSEKED